MDRAVTDDTVEGGADRTPPSEPPAAADPSDAEAQRPPGGDAAAPPSAGAPTEEGAPSDASVIDAATAAADGKRDDPSSTAMAAPPAVVPTKRPLWRRILEIAAPLVVALAVGLGFFALRPAKGYAFHASSTYSGYKQNGFTGRIGSGDLIFCTNHEPSPNVVIDVDPPKTIHRVKVVNRKEYRERAAPLVVEVENPDGTWREVARRVHVFERWTAEFPPVATAHVRLRVDRPSWLHLSRVYID